MTHIGKILILLILLLAIPAMAGETMASFLRDNIEPGKNIWDVQDKLHKEVPSVEFIMLHNRQTRSHFYQFWSVRVLGVECYRIFTDNGIIESVTEHPGLSK
jgi:hypothetical protein